VEDFRYSLYAYPSFGSVSLPTWWPSTCDTWPCEVGPDAGRVHLAESFKFTLEEGDLSHAPLGPIPRALHSAGGNQETILLYVEKYENAVQSGGHRDEEDELEAGNDNHSSKSFSDTSVMPDGRFAHRDTDSEHRSCADQEEEGSSDNESEEGCEPSHADSSTVIKSAGYIEKPKVRLHREAECVCEVAREA